MPDMTDKYRLLDIPKAAAVLGCTPRALRRRVERGHMPAVRVGRRIYIAVEDIRRVVDDGRHRASATEKEQEPGG